VIYVNLLQVLFVVHKGNNMQCQFCHKLIKPKKNAHNVKFCSVLCRNREIYHNRGGKEWTKRWVERERLKDNRPKVQCLICKKWYRQVGSHIYQTHNVTAREYRLEYGFDLKRGQLPEDLRAIKADHTMHNGTVNNLKAGKKNWFKKGDKKAGRYTRSEQTLARLKTLNKFNKK